VNQNSYQEVKIHLYKMAFVALDPAPLWKHHVWFTSQNTSGENLNKQTLGLSLRGYKAFKAGGRL
jgi:hypothetical protein